MKEAKCARGQNKGKFRGQKPKSENLFIFTAAQPALLLPGRLIKGGGMVSAAFRLFRYTCQSLKPSLSTSKGEMTNELHFLLLFFP